MRIALVVPQLRGLSTSLAIAPQVPLGHLLVASELKRLGAEPYLINADALRCDAIEAVFFRDAIFNIDHRLMLRAPRLLLLAGWFWLLPLYLILWIKKLSQFSDQIDTTPAGRAILAGRVWILVIAMVVASLVMQIGRHIEFLNGTRGAGRLSSVSIHHLALGKTPWTFSARVVAILLELSFWVGSTSGKIITTALFSALLLRLRSDNARALPTRFSYSFLFSSHSIFGLVSTSTTH
jgi:hypothetical protein